MAFIEISYGQNISGTATYMTSSKVRMDFDSTHVSPEQMQKMRSELAKKMQKEYDLVFDGTKSHWKQKESLNSGPASVSSNGMEVIMMSGDEKDVLYKDLKAQRFKRSTELMGKKFLVEDELPQYDWRLTGEKKKIGNYLCEQAIYQRISDAKTFSSGEDEMKVVKDTVEIVAWFTPEILVNNGPRNYHGLPGLIMELSNGFQKVICTKIVLNPTEKVKVEVPSRGEKVSEQEFQAISEEKMKEMMNRYRGEGDGEIEIVIGG